MLLASDFFRAYPALRWADVCAEQLNAISSLWDSICSSGRTITPNQSCGLANLDFLKTDVITAGEKWWENEYYFAAVKVTVHELLETLKSESLSPLTTDWYGPAAELPELLDRVAKFGDEKSASSFESACSKISFRIGNFTLEACRDSLGLWGVELFYFNGHRRFVPTSAKDDIALRKHCDNLAQVADEYEKFDRAHTKLVLNQSTFELQGSNGKPVVKFGNTKPFWMLKTLIDRSGRLVPHIELAEAMGGDAQSVDSLKVTKNRLVNILKNHGLTRFAECIEGETGHYGFFPSSETKM